VAPSGEQRGKGRCGGGVFADKTVWSTPERLIGEVLTTRRYTNLRLRLRLRLPLPLPLSALNLFGNANKEKVIGL